MTTESIQFKDISLLYIRVSEIIEVENTSRDRYQKYLRSPPSSYVELLSEDEISRVLVLAPIVVVKVNPRSDNNKQYRVIGGLKSFSIVSSRVKEEKSIPVILFRRNSPKIRHRINTSELVTLRALYESEKSAASWLQMHDELTDAEDLNGSPNMGIGQLKILLNRSRQAIENWRKKNRSLQDESQS